MAKAFFELGYRSDKHVRGRLFTYQVDPAAKGVPHNDFRSWIGPTVELRLREAYEAYQCLECGRLDELKCFEQGIPPEFVVPRPRHDLYVTEEYIDVWSRRLAEDVISIAGDQLHLFDLPGDPEYVLPWPKRIIGVPAGTKIFKTLEPPLPGNPFRVFGPPCTVCGRYPSTTFRANMFVPPDDVSIAAVGINTAYYPALSRSLTWVVAAPIAQKLRARRYSNVTFKPKFAV